MRVLVPLLEFNIIRVPERLSSEGATLVNLEQNSELRNSFRCSPTPNLGTAQFPARRLWPCPCEARLTIENSAPLLPALYYRDDLDGIWSTQISPAPHRDSELLRAGTMLRWQEVDRPGAVRAFRVVSPRSSASSIGSKSNQSRRGSCSGTRSTDHYDYFRQNCPCHRSIAWYRSRHGSSSPRKAK